MTDTQPPLAGIRVLDVSTVLAAPVTATFLGDFGADVVKVEEPGRGDFTRGEAGQDAPGKRSLQWAQEGRNKKSVTIDLRTERGQELLNVPEPVLHWFQTRIEREAQATGRQAMDLFFGLFDEYRAERGDTAR
ncbi:CoA transferase [Streptomyces olivaceus]|uniref:CoA transferase n=1 Tax=Streptomyces olivaceus TaxID=47716 RepID=UPI0036EEBF3F